MANSSFADLVCHLAFIHLPFQHIAANALAGIDSCDFVRFAERLGQYAHEAGFARSWLPIVVVALFFSDLTSLDVADSVGNGASCLSGSLMERCAVISNAHPSSEEPFFKGSFACERHCF